ncbi:TPA: serine protease [Escherichia coli]|uniref:Trypsin-like peptidase domain-containing protein n=1 Tax=Escherichia coli TaxID=562 RepID=A0A830V4X4_ECOLX|nr:serine protease [Escherichia coli]HCL1528966.1 trypsin-like peptidase domain-containing protein [Salmonella enterica subsp. enterica serovar 4,12:i:-]HCL1571626.1 trypsin-like peptidase domain-containing protein [Salmonella enterica subsp. enterica serovar Brandenburg]EEV5716938.1 serine protease [Escherichia coli]EEX9668463.1 serine protease [Escherichia coli]EEY0082702.1 serine protease [Escherichia coli]
MGNIDPLSLVTTMVSLNLNGVQVSQGTGFFYQSIEEQLLFLVTNYHVVTGHSPQSKESPLGDSISFKVRVKSGGSKTIEIPLFKNGKPTWLQHASKKNADIAVIPLFGDNLKDCEFEALNSGVKNEDVYKGPTARVTLIGYPYGFHDAANMLPVWKTGSVASEPEYDFNGEKTIVLDISAFPGMSGSPAMIVAKGGYGDKDGNMYAGNAYHFLGIYASMNMFNSELNLEQVSNDAKKFVTHTESLQLGIIWKASLIDDIVNNFNLESWLQGFRQSALQANLKLGNGLQLSEDGKSVIFKF